MSDFRAWEPSWGFLQAVVAPRPVAGKLAQVKLSIKNSGRQVPCSENREVGQRKAGSLHCVWLCRHRQAWVRVSYSRRENYSRHTAPSAAP